jgi:hypothetical protein
VSLGAACVAGLAIYAALTVSLIDLTYAILMLGVAFWLVRLSMMGIDVMPNGIRVANPFRTTWIPWAQFGKFAVGRFRGWQGTVTLERRDGGQVPIRVFASSPLYYDARVDGILEELQGMAARRSAAIEP